MPDPVHAVSYRDISWVDQPSDRADFRETIVRGARHDEIYSVCRDPPTVLGAAIWGDETDVSKACRCADPGSLDALICDDFTLQTAQNSAAYLAQKAAELVLGSKMGRSK